MEARAARRALARAAAVRAGRGRVGKALQAMTWSVIATPRFSCGPGHVASRIRLQVRIRLQAVASGRCQNAHFRVSSRAKLHYHSYESKRLYW